MDEGNRFEHAKANPKNQPNMTADSRAYSPESPSTFALKMNQSFRIPLSRWSLIWIPLIFLLQIPIFMGRYGEFSEDPSHKTGWMLFAWILIACFWLVSAIRRFRTADVISVEDEEIRFQRARGERTWPPETVTTVTDDQIAFHLFSKKNEISLSKKKVPSELAQYLNERVMVETGANTSAMASLIPFRVD